MAVYGKFTTGGYQLAFILPTSLYARQRSNYYSCVLQISAAFLFMSNLEIKQTVNLVGQGEDGPDTAQVPLFCTSMKNATSHHA